VFVFLRRGFFEVENGKHDYIEFISGAILGALGSARAGQNKFSVGVIPVLRAWFLRR
jgi:hypothetical protein